jgi:hypothetical protein
VEGSSHLAIGVLYPRLRVLQGVFPKPPDFATLRAFDLSSSHRTAVHAAPAHRVPASACGRLRGAQRTRPGVSGARCARLTILRDRRRYFPRGLPRPARRWGFRFTASGSCSRRSGSAARAQRAARLGVNAVRGHRPVHSRAARACSRALLVKVFAGARRGPRWPPTPSGSRSHRVALVALGFAALVFVFRFRSFREVIASGKRRGRRRRPDGQPRSSSRRRSGGHRVVRRQAPDVDEGGSSAKASGIRGGDHLIAGSRSAPVMNRPRCGPGPASCASARSTLTVRPTDRARRRWRP